MSFQERAKHPIHEHCIKADVLSKEGLKEQTSVAIERRQESCYSKESMMTKIGWLHSGWSEFLRRQDFAYKLLKSKE